MWGNGSSIYTTICQRQHRWSENQLQICNRHVKHQKECANNIMLSCITSHGCNTAITEVFVLRTKWTWQERSYNTVRRKCNLFPSTLCLSYVNEVHDKFMLCCFCIIIKFLLHPSLTTTIYCMSVKTTSHPLGFLVHFIYDEQVLTASAPFLKTYWKHGLVRLR